MHAFQRRGAFERTLRKHRRHVAGGTGVLIADGRLLLYTLLAHCAQVELSHFDATLRLVMLSWCEGSRRLLDVGATRSRHGRWLCRLHLRVKFRLSAQAKWAATAGLGPLVEAAHGCRKRSRSLLLALLHLFVGHLKELLLLFLWNFLVEGRVHAVCLGALLRL